MRKGLFEGRFGVIFSSEIGTSLYISKEMASAPNVGFVQSGDLILGTSMWWKDKYTTYEALYEDTGQTHIDFSVLRVKDGFGFLKPYMKRMLHGDLTMIVSLSHDDLTELVLRYA
jgi:hypothetical protein